MNQCLICKKDIPEYNVYCSDIHCQNQYEIRLRASHSKKEYKQYIVIWKTIMFEVYQSNGEYYNPEDR